MEIAPHDLLRIQNSGDIIGSLPKPEWVNEALKRAPFVVVRRAPFFKSQVPVGIRGESRNKRSAGLLLKSNIANCISPREIVTSKLWRNTPRRDQIQVFLALDFVDKIFMIHGLSWGPTGSVGFELVSDRPTVNNSSDLDIVIYVPQLLSVKIAKQIAEELRKAPVPVDAQLETPNGAVALEEYVRGETLILLRTINGPRLVENPWAKDKLLEVTL